LVIIEEKLGYITTIQHPPSRPEVSVQQTVNLLRYGRGINNNQVEHYDGLVSDVKVNSITQPCFSKRVKTKRNYSQLNISDMFNKKDRRDSSLEVPIEIILPADNSFNISRVNSCTKCQDGLPEPEAMHSCLDHPDDSLPIAEPADSILRAGSIASPISSTVRVLTSTPSVSSLISSSLSSSTSTSFCLSASSSVPLRPSSFTSYQSSLDVPRSKPHQPRDFHFPLDTSKRKFRSEWFDQFPWLEWDEGRRNVGAALCFVCRQGHIRGLIESNNSEESFRTTGYCNWKNGSSNFRKHESSESHRVMQYRLSALLDGINVSAQLDVQADTQRKENTKNLITIFSSLKFLARQGLSTRGHEDSGSNFHELMRIRCEDRPQLMDWLSKKTTWTSHAIQEEIIKMMGMTVMREVAKEIRAEQLFAIIADETADVSRKEQLVLCVRTVDDNLQAHENVLGLHTLPHCDAETITGIIVDILIRFGLDIRNCRAVCFDGAATFSGLRTGVGKRLQNEERRINVIHCAMHCVNLAVQEAVKEVSVLRNFMTLVGDLVNFLRDSPKRCQTVETIANALSCRQTHVRPLCPTRFTVKYHALDGMNKQLPVLKEALSTIECDAENKDIRSRASGFHDKLEHFEFYFGLQVSLTIFEITDRLSSQLQGKAISIGQGMQFVQYAINELTSLRSDHSFHDVWELAINHSETMNAKQPELPRRQASAPKRFQSSRSHTFTAVEDYYRAQYFEVLDHVITCLSERITNKEIPVLQAIETLLQCAWNGDALNMDDIQAVCSHYGNELDKSRLVAQLQGIENLRAVSVNQVKSTDELSVNKSAIDIIQAIGATSLKVMMPQVVQICKLYLVNPATTATAERTFSRLRCLKTYLRSTMTQARLNSLMMLSIYSDILDKVDMKQLVNDFINSGDSKRSHAFALLV
jgi:hypothetical protein